MSDYDFTNLEKKSQTLNQVSDELSKKIMQLNKKLKSLNLGIELGLDDCAFPLYFRAIRPDDDPAFEGEELVVAEFLIQPKDTLEAIIKNESIQKSELESDFGHYYSEEYLKERTFPAHHSLEGDFLAFTKLKGDWQLVCQSGEIE